jgi:Leucine rich repeat variant
MFFESSTANGDKSIQPPAQTSESPLMKEPHSIQRAAQGVEAVAADLGSGIKDEIIHNPTRIVENFGTGMMISIGFSKLGAPIKAIIGVAAAAQSAYGLYENTPGWLKDAKIVGGWDNASAGETQVAHAQLQGLGAGATDLTFLAIGTGAMLSRRPSEFESVATLVEEKAALSEVQSSRVAVAGNTNTPPEILERLAVEKQGDARDQLAIHEQLALNSSTPPKVLIELAKQENCFPKILAILGKEGEHSVREAVAGNKNTPPETLLQLAHDRASWVQLAAVANASMPADVLTELVNDQTLMLWPKVAAHPNTSIDTLKDLADDWHSWTRMAVAQNRSAPSAVLAQLANDKNSNVRFNVAENENTLYEVLVKLADDKSSYVRAAALKRLSPSE